MSPAPRAVLPPPIAAPLQVERVRARMPAELRLGVDLMTGAGLRMREALTLGPGALVFHPHPLITAPSDHFDAERLAVCPFLVVELRELLATRRPGARLIDPEGEHLPARFYNAWRVAASEAGTPELHPAHVRRMHRAYLQLPTPPGDNAAARELHLADQRAALTSGRVADLDRRIRAARARAEEELAVECAA